MSFFAAFALLGTLFLGCTTAPKLPEFQGLEKPRHGGPRFFLVSLDGSSPQDLYTLLEQGFVKPQGVLGDLESWSRADRALPAGITLTAPSHVSIETCSTPDVHGIPANTFLRNGEEVSGFEVEIFAETIWESAKRQGRKVLSVGFIGADGRSPRRQASAGFAYPRTELVGKSMLVPIKLKDLKEVTFAVKASSGSGKGQRVTSNWNIGTRKPRGKFFESQVDVVANVTTKEMKSLFFLWEVRSQQDFIVTVDQDQDLTNGFVGELKSKNFEAEHLNVIWTEQDPKSPIQGRKRRSFISLLRSETKEDDFALYVSKPNYNNAYPQEFLDFLEAENLVWADKGFPDFNESGGRISPGKYLAGLQIQNQLLADAVRKAQARWDFDVVLFYQPLIDSFQHAYFARQPEINAQNAKKDSVLRSLIVAYDSVLKNVNGLLSLGEAADVFTITGDHGMEPVRKMINSFALVGPPPSGVKVISSGGILLLYADKSPLGQESGDYIQKLTSRLQSLYFDGKPVTRGIYLKEENPERWLYGDAVAAVHSGPDFYIHFKPELSQLVIDPPFALGMHGHESDLASMSTIFLTRDPRLKSARFSTIDLRDVVPTGMAAVGMKPPKQCQGQDLGASGKR